MEASSAETDAGKAETGRTGPGRIAAVDVARGLALVAMAIYHGAWDTGYVRLTRVDVGQDPGWVIFARLIAGTFLFLVGVSLVLSTRNGFRPRPYFRRLGLIVAAALLVTVATRAFMPEGFIFFGILHEIALASVLALPFLVLPVPVAAGAAGLFLVLPHLVRHEVFGAPLLWWVGLAPTPPLSFDYVPVFPWFGCVLAGLVAARLAIAAGLDRRLAGWAPVRAPGRLLALAGRNSLAVYLLHQPVLIAFFYGLSLLFVPGGAEGAFRDDCSARCEGQGYEAKACVAYCGCIVDELRAGDLLARALANQMSPADMNALTGITAVCRGRVVPPPPAGDGSP